MFRELDMFDIAVLIAMLIVSWVIGLYYGCKKSDFGDRSQIYLVGNRKVGVLPAALSITATSMSATTMIGVCAEVYLYGVQYVFFAFGGIIGMIFVATGVVPVYRRLQCISIYEYLEKRYDRSMRTLFSTMYVISGLGLSAVVLYVPALCLTTLSSIPYWLSIVVSGCVCTLYCTMGGIKAVIWTDVVQIIFMVVCNSLFIYFGLVKVGGFNNVWEAALVGERLTYFPILEDENTRYSVWSLFFGGMVITMGFMVSSQAGLQRILCVRGVRQARLATILSGVFVMVFLISTIAAATVIYSNFAKCDPFLRLNETGVKEPDQIMIYALKDLLDFPGLKGLAVAGIFSGALSSFSSIINSFATVTVEDFFLPMLRSCNRSPSDRRKLLICKLLTLTYGMICMLLTFFVPHLGGINKTSMQICGAIGAPLTAAILLGMLSRKSNTKGVLLGLILGLAFTIWVSLGSTLYQRQLRTLPLSDEACPIDARRGRSLDDLNSWTLEPANVTTKTTTETNQILWTIILLNNSTEWAFKDVVNKTSLDQFYVVSNNGTSQVLPFTEREKSSDILPVYKLSFMWYGPMGFVITFFVGLVLSEVIGSDPSKVDPSLLSPLIRNDSEYQIRLSDNQSIRMTFGKQMFSDDSIGTRQSSDNLTTSDVEETSRI